MNTQDTQRGFIALMTVIIVGAILMVMIFTLGASAFLNRFSTFDTENKRISLALAESCANAAMIRIAQNPSYSPVGNGECVSVGGTCPAGKMVCKICEVTPVGGPNYTIYARASYNGAFTNIEVDGSIVSDNFSVTRWVESPDYDTSLLPACPLP